MKTNILIPMAGEGKRFKEAGYADQKQMIPVCGAPMVSHVVSNLFERISGDELFFVIKNGGHIYSGIPVSVFYKVDETTEGPACTALVAKKSIDNSTPLLIANCDQIIKDYSKSIMEEFAEIHNADVVLGCFLSTSPKNSYVRVDDSGQITEVREKQVISNIATNGLHWFRRGSDFVRAAEQMIAADDRTNGEFYIAPSVNYLIAEGAKVMPFFFNLHFPVGTPEDLQKYEAIYAKT